MANFTQGVSPSDFEKQFPIFVTPNKRSRLRSRRSDTIKRKTISTSLAAKDLSLGNIRKHIRKSTKSSYTINLKSKHTHVRTGYTELDEVDDNNDYFYYKNA